MIVPTTKMRQKVCSIIFPLKRIKLRINFCTQNCTYIWVNLAKNSAQWKIRSLRLSDAVKLSLKETKYIKEYIYNRSFQRFPRLNLFMLTLLGIC